MPSDTGCTEPKICMTVSLKGGVGKSTICANVSAALAEHGKRVLVLDCDFICGGLDCLLGVDTDSVYGIEDALLAPAVYEKYCVAVPTLPTLSVLPEKGGFTGNPVSADALKELLHHCIRDRQYDYIFLDMPANSTVLPISVCPLVDCAILISTAQNTAVRSAESTALMLCEHGVRDCQLILNQYIPLFGKSNHLSAEDIVALTSLTETVSVRLGGVVPYEKNLSVWQNKGFFVSHPVYRKSPFANAIHHIASRICGVSVPLSFSVN